MDQRTTLEEVIADIRDGMTIGIGGWGSRRKPMAFVRALLRSPVRDLRVVSFGGPDVGLLCAAGKVREVAYGFVTLDSIPLEPHFRRAREQGRIAAREYDEGMLVTGLEAAARRLPFLPIRAGLGSSVLEWDPGLRTIRSPYADGEELVAMTAIPLDVAVVHVNRADARGNGQILGPDPYLDVLMVQASRRSVLTCERVVDTRELTAGGCVHTLAISRLWVDGVVETPGGAHFTSCVPDYPRDEAFQRHYADAAADPEAWERFRTRFLDVPDEETYQQAVAAWRSEQGQEERR